jgi:hypothetical protein
MNGVGSGAGDGDYKGTKWAMDKKGVSAVE